MHQSNFNFNSSRVLRFSGEHTESDDLKNNFNVFFEMESMVIKNNGWEEPNSFIEKFENNLYFNGKRYITRLPYKDESEFLPDSYEHMKQRLLLLKNNLIELKNC